MSTLSKTYKIALAALLGLLVFGFMIPDPVDMNGLIVIVNPDSPDQVSQAEFMKIIRGQQQRWKDGKTVHIALMKTKNPTGQKTAEEIYGMSGDELNKYWLSLVFAGQALAPEFYNTEQELIDYVANTPGAIGIVSSVNTTEVKKLSY